MTIQRVLAAGALAAAGLAAPAAQAAVLIDPISGSVEALASAQLGEAPAAVDVHDASWNGGGPQTLTQSAAAFVLGGADSITSVGGIRATWASATAGEVRVGDSGWTVAAGDPAVDFVAPSLSPGFGGTPAWSYTFTAGRDATFNLSADFLGSGTDLAGLGFWDVVVDDGVRGIETSLLNGYGLVPFFRTSSSDGEPLQDEITGSFSQSLEAGRTYTISLLNLEGFSLAGDTSNASTQAFEDGTFEWSVTPEPSAWALAIVGLGLTGTAVRRRGLKLS
jgi:hypothetical protein